MNYNVINELYLVGQHCNLDYIQHLETQIKDAKRLYYKSNGKISDIIINESTEYLRHYKREGNIILNR